MTPEQVKELLPMLTAFSEGKEIECCIDGVWFTWDGPHFNFSELRIKPQPKKIRCILDCKNTQRESF